MGIVYGRIPVYALSDRDVVVLGNYMLTHYGSVDTAITEQQVAEERRGGPSSLPPALARGGHGSHRGRRVLGHCLSHRPATKEFQQIMT